MPRAKKFPVRKTCLHCSAEFSTTDTRKVYCGRPCKDAALKHASKSAQSVTVKDQCEARRNMERRATQVWMYEMIFGTAPAFRADIIMAFLVFAATSYNSRNTGAKRYRDILTYPTAQRSNRFTAKDKGTVHLHHLGRPLAYPATIASMANHVCKFHLGMSSSAFIAEIRRDGVTMADMQDVYSELMDRTKPEPVIRGCDIEERANGPLEPLTASQIAHTQTVLADPQMAAKQAAVVGRGYLARRRSEISRGTKSDDHARRLGEQTVEAQLAKQAEVLSSVQSRFEHLVAAE